MPQSLMKQSFQIPESNYSALVHQKNMIQSHLFLLFSKFICLAQTFMTLIVLSFTTIDVFTKQKNCKNMTYAQLDKNE